MAQTMEIGPAGPLASAAPARAPKILAVSGSLRKGSHNSKLLSAAAELFPTDVEVEFYDDLKAIPPYDEDDDVEPSPAPVAWLRAAIANADGLLIATPEYNSSVPGQLKNALDWASRPLATNVLRNKPVAVIGASAGAFGAVWAQAELRKVLAATGARVLDVELAVGHAEERFDGDGSLADGELHEQLNEVLDTLLESIRTRALTAAAA
ncbi:MAG TPA: NAD(P)H-dependent oxidoreductase [Solirubrobacteraceae bacterium]|nr:NAD(P)H-dependent oxidoreductase [Solirubrobacteraceae bacterium]